MFEEQNDIRGEYTDSSATKLDPAFGEEFESTAGMVLSKIEELGALLDRIREKTDLSQFADAFRQLSSKFS